MINRTTGFLCLTNCLTVYVCIVSLSVCQWSVKVLQDEVWLISNENKTLDHPRCPSEKLLSEHFERCWWPFSWFFLIITSLSSLSLSQYSSVSWSAAIKTRLTSCWQRAESGAQAKKTVETDLSMPLVISFNIIKSFYSFRSSRGPPARDDERCREGFTRPSVSLCQQSCLPSLLSLPLPNKVT